MTRNFNSFQNPQVPQMGQMPHTSQYQQQIFLQSQGSVYIINSSAEVNSMPISAGVSVALCFSEGMCYLKSMQNGKPMILAYNLIPYTPEKSQEEEKGKTIEDLLNSYDQRLKTLEDQNKKGGQLNELI